MITKNKLVAQNQNWKYIKATAAPSMITRNKLVSLNLIFRCTHMCLIKKGGQEGVCKCATLFKLVNGHDCIPDVHIPSFSNISLPAIGKAFQPLEAGIWKALNMYIRDAIMAIDQFEKGCTFANTFLSTFLDQAYVCAPENKIWWD